MAILRLSLTDYRSYTSALIAADSGFVVLTGENGAGKTNVLEALSLLTPGRGLRGAALSEMARSSGPGGFSVAARIQAPGGLIDIGTGTAASAPERRQVRINGAAKSATAMGEWLSLLWITPAMDRLFNESAGGRRRFLDRLVQALEPAHATHAARYEAAMRARNKLLGGEEVPDPIWLGSLEIAMAEHGVAVAEARARTVAALARRLATQPEGPFARAGLCIESWAPTVDDPIQAFAAALRAGRARDAGAGRTLAGPHRSDLAAVHLGKGQPADRCSTGEQKALLLGIVLAHADIVAEDRGQRPILLLDEVAAHLDPLRRAALFERLALAGGQVWMTGTEAALFAELGPDATWLAVADGGIARI